MVGKDLRKFPVTPYPNQAQRDATTSNTISMLISVFVGDKQRFCFDLGSRITLKSTKPTLSNLFYIFHAYINNLNV